MERSRRRPRRRRLAGALALAVVTITTLALAGPAVALRPPAHVLLARHAGSAGDVAAAAARATFFTGVAARHSRGVGITTGATTARTFGATAHRGQHTAVLGAEGSLAAATLAAVAAIALIAAAVAFGERGATAARTRRKAGKAAAGRRLPV